jgi:hypothetical protein
MMKKAAFYLVAFVASIQVLIVAMATGACLVTKPNAETCDPGGELGQLMSAVVTQVFALYAAEK